MTVNETGSAGRESLPSSRKLDGALFRQVIIDRREGNVNYKVSPKGRLAVLVVSVNSRQKVTGIDPGTARSYVCRLLAVIICIKIHFVN